MENEIEEQVTQNEPVETVEVSAAELADLRRKAEVSSNNFARLKKAEAEKNELATKLKEGGETTTFDSSSLEKKIEERVNLRLQGYDAEHIVEIERYAKGANISLSEAAQSPFVKKATDALMAEKKSLESTPASSSRIRTFNGVPTAQVLSEGSASDKQAAFESIVRGGRAKNNE